MAGTHRLVVATLGRRIVNGDLGAGVSLPSEAQLLEEFEISRTTLREALRVLSAKGLIESRQKRGTYVSPPRSWSMLDPDVLSWLEPRSLTRAVRDAILEFRRVIEPAAAELAAARAEPDGIAAMQSAFRTMEAGTGNRQAYFRADLEFHNCLFAATGNPFVVSLGRAAHALLGFAFSLQQHSLIEGREALDLHRALLDAIAKGQPAAARAAMLTIIERAGEELDAFIHSASTAGKPRRQPRKVIKELAQ
jgi:GntR family galactonate operon transcriptional repressor